MAGAIVLDRMPGIGSELLPAREYQYYLEHDAENFEHWDRQETKQREWDSLSYRLRPVRVTISGFGQGSTELAN